MRRSGCHASAPAADRPPSSGTDGAVRRRMMSGDDHGAAGLAGAVRALHFARSRACGTPLSGGRPAAGGLRAAYPGCPARCGSGHPAPLVSTRRSPVIRPNGGHERTKTLPFVLCIAAASCSAQTLVIGLRRLRGPFCQRNHTSHRDRLSGVGRRGHPDRLGPLPGSAGPGAHNRVRNRAASQPNRDAAQFSRNPELQGRQGAASGSV